MFANDTYMSEAIEADIREDAIQIRADQVAEEMRLGLDDELLGQAIGWALDRMDTEFAKAIREACSDDNNRLRRIMDQVIRDESWAYAEAEMGGPY